MIIQNNDRPVYDFLAYNIKGIQELNGITITKLYSQTKEKKILKKQNYIPFYLYA